MFTNKNAFPERSWGAEFGRRLASRVIDESLNKPHDWLRQQQALMSLKSPVLLKVDSLNWNIAGVPCLSVIPKNKPYDKTIVYFHGGGYVIGSAKGYHVTLAHLANECGARVLGVEYRCTPEATIDELWSDCSKVIDALAGEREQFILMGDSAGAGLVLEMCQRLKHKIMLDHLSHIVLLSPWVTPSQPDLLDHQYEQGDILSAALLKRWYDATVPHADQAELLDYQDRDWRGLPPTYLQIAGAEMFRSQGEAFAKTLAAAEVDVSFDLMPDQFHVFQTLAPMVIEARPAIHKISQFLDSKPA